MQSSDSRDGLLSDVPLAPLTTLGLGGAARYMVAVESPEDVVESVRWARRREVPLGVLGGGSNIVVADEGFGGLILRSAVRGLEFRRDRDDVLVSAGSAEDWDEVVAETVSRDLAGLECLSGIPGRVGATPIQNVGAYGQEVSEVVERIRAVDLENLEEVSIPPSECRFGYRSSIFRDRPGRFFILEVTYRLRPGGAPALKYGDLRSALKARSAEPLVAEVREAVLALRRSKSMVLDADDPNSRSAGSFFVNPVVSEAALERLSDRGRESGVLAGDERVPSFDIGGGAFKVAAAWLIESAGFRKGMRRGAVALSSAHALALVHHGGGTTSQLLALAREIRDGVHRVFGIELRPEPVFVGFGAGNPLDG